MEFPSTSFCQPLLQRMQISGNRFSKLAVAMLVMS
jgi:hypothetical protein